MFTSGSLKYTDVIDPVAPVRLPGPSMISTLFASRCSTTSGARRRPAPKAIERTLVAYREVR